VAGLALCTLGDLLLDVIVRLDGPLEGGTDTAARTRTGAGGQAANVAAWAAALGAEARFVGKRGDDPAGALVAGELTGRGVTVLGPGPAGRNGIVVSLVGADGDRAMATDRGVAPTLTAEELDARWFDGSGHLHLSGYSVMSSPMDGAALRAAAIIREAGGRVSVDLSSVSVIRTFGVDRLRRRLTELAPNVVFANEHERDEVSDVPGTSTWVVKRGAAGCLVQADGSVTDHQARPAKVIDTTGAGDAFAAGYLVGGVELALDAAARCVAQLGAMP
jgi:sugar/nucleoside kinase (ribokinase family)